MALAALVGFLFGFLGSVPVAGPIAVLVFSRGVDGRHRSGMSIAVGGALAEGIFACLAFWGFAEFLARYPVMEPISRVLAVVVLTILGVTFLRRKVTTHLHSDRKEGWGGGFMLGFSITALNPTLIATWAFATSTLFSTNLVEFTPIMTLPFGGGAIVGIVAWFTVLLQLVRKYRERFSEHTLNRVIQVMGVFVLVVAAGFAVMLVHGLLND